MPLIMRIGIDFVVDGGLVAKNFCETTDILAAPRGVHFTVAAKPAVHQVMRAFDAVEGKSVGVHGTEYRSADRQLAVFEETFDVAHGWVEHLAFVKPVAIPGGQLFFPMQLPLGEGVFFQQVVRFDDEEGGGGFKAHTAFYADDGIAHMDIASDAEGLCELL